MRRYCASVIFVPKATPKAFPLPFANNPSFLAIILDTNICNIKHGCHRVLFSKFLYFSLRLVKGQFPQVTK